MCTCVYVYIYIYTHTFHCVVEPCLLVLSSYTCEYILIRRSYSCCVWSMQETSATCGNSLRQSLSAMQIFHGALPVCSSFRFLVGFKDEDEALLHSLIRHQLADIVFQTRVPVQPRLSGRRGCTSSFCRRPVGWALNELRSQSTSNYDHPFINCRFS